MKRLSGVVVAVVFALSACSTAAPETTTDEQIAAELAEAGYKPNGTVQQWKDAVRPLVCEGSDDTLQLMLAMNKDKGQDATNRSIRIAVKTLCPNRLGVVDEQLGKMS